MATGGEPSERVLREPLIPDGLAQELVPLLTEIRNRWCDLERAGSRSGQPLQTPARANLNVATLLVLGELDRCIDLARGKGVQVRAERWASVLADLRSLKRKLGTQP